MLVGVPWERVAIDITGKHPKSRNGKEYMLTVMDHFSKCAEAYPFKDHKAPTVAKILVEQLFSRLGMPYQLLSDQGPEFGCELFLEMFNGLSWTRLRRAHIDRLVMVCHRTLNYVWKNHQPAGLGHKGSVCHGGV